MQDVGKRQRTRNRRSVRTKAGSNSCGVSPVCQPPAVAPRLPEDAHFTAGSHWSPQPEVFLACTSDLGRIPSIYSFSKSKRNYQ